MDLGSYGMAGPAPGLDPVVGESDTFLGSCRVPGNDSAKYSAFLSNFLANSYW